MNKFLHVHIHTHLILFLYVAMLRYTAAQNQPATLQSLLDTASEVSETNPDSALFILNKAYKISTENDSAYLQRVYNRMAQAYSMKGDYATAAELSFKAIKWATKAKDTAALIDANNNLGIDLMYQEDYHASLGYLNLVVKLAIASKDSLRLGHAYNNIGISVGYLGRANEELTNYEKAAEIFKKINEKEGYANTLLNKATVYTQFKKYPKADVLFKEAIKIYEALGYENAINMALQSLAENSLMAGKPNEALKYAKQALNIAGKNGYKTEVSSALRIISHIFKKINKPDSAYYYLEKHIKAKDEVFSIEKSKVATELEKKYQSELKEEKIKELEQLNTIKTLENKQALQRTWLVLAVALLILAIAIAFYILYRLKRKNEQVLDKKNAELEQLNQFKDRIFAVISHDLRSPLNAFEWIIQSLSKNWEHASKNDINDFLNTTLQSAQQLKYLLNNLLEWALVQMGKMPFSPKQVPLKDLVNAANGHVHNLALQKNIKINIQPINEYVWVDTNMITIALRNLLSNAIKFSPQHSTIDIYATVNHQHPCLVIQDYGIGMSPQQVSELMNKHFDKSRIGNSIEKGSGIGFMIADELLEKNHANITVQSALGEGSKFTICFHRPA